MTSASVDLNYDAYGPENDDPPIIFLHALMTYKEHWIDIPKNVADKVQRKVYRLDARNHGDSPWTDEFNFDLNVDDLMHFMDTHQIEKATLVGHNMGGTTSLKMALRAPERVEKVVSEDMGTRKVDQALVDLTIDSIKTLQDVVASIPCEMGEEDAVQFMIKEVYEKMPEEMRNMTKQETLNSYATFFKLDKSDDGVYICNKVNLDGIMLALKQSQETLMSPFEGVYDGPVHVIYGDLSEFKVGEDQEGMKEFFPNAEFIKIEDATHDVHSDKPDEFIEALLSVLLKD